MASSLLAYTSSKMKLSSTEMGKTEREAGCGGGDQSILTRTFCEIGPGLRKEKNESNWNSGIDYLFKDFCFPSKELGETTTGVGM